MVDPISLENVAPSELMITSRRDADALVLSLSGELDLSSSPVLEKELDAMAVDGSARVVIDLGGLEFMDSSGLQMLLRARERATENELDFSLVRGRPGVHRVFELTRTDELFAFED